MGDMENPDMVVFKTVVVEVPEAATSGAEPTRSGFAWNLWTCGDAYHEGLCHWRRASGCGGMERQERLRAVEGGMVSETETWRVVTTTRARVGMVQESR